MRTIFGAFVCAVIVLLCSIKAWAAPLQTISTYCTAHQDQCQKGTVSLWAAKGTTDNLEYMVEVDPTTGDIPTSGGGGGGGGFPTGGTPALLYYNDFSSASVTTTYTEISASLATSINDLKIFECSGLLFALATGAAGMEVDFAFIPPGGTSAGIPIQIAAGQRLSFHTAGAGGTASTCYISITGIH